MSKDGERDRTKFQLKHISRKSLTIILLSLPLLLAYQNCGRPMTAMEYEDLLSTQAEDPDIYKQISAGGNFACGVLDSGFVKCWGQNHFGQLGNGTTIDSNVPVQVVGLNNVASVHVSMSTNSNFLPESFACALLLDGTARCWGNNKYGQLGMGLVGSVDSSGNTYSTQPLEVLNVSGATQLSVGSASTCVVLKDKTAKCWGNLNSGYYIPSPVVVNGLTNIKKISSQVSLFSISEDGVMRSTVYAFTNSATPFFTEVINNIPLAKDFAAQDFNFCVVTLEGGVTCKGNQYFLNIFGVGGGVIDLDVENAKSIVVSQKTACVRLEDDSLKCLGKNSTGALGNNSLTDSTEFTPVANINQINDVSTGDRFTCALDQAGLAYCWGLGVTGQLGSKNHSDYGTATAKKIIQDDIKTMSLSDGHTCALLNDGTVTCWGSDYAGQLGDGGMSSVGKIYFNWDWSKKASSAVSVVPKVVEGLSNVIKLASSAGRTCALLSSGQVKCWGYNYHRLQNDNSTLLNDSVPVLVPNLNDATDIASDGYLGEFCVIRSDKSVWCFGLISAPGGSGGELIISDTPIKTGLDNINYIRVHALNGVCGVTADATKTIKCWIYGQPVFTQPINDVVAFSNVANYSNSHFCAILTSGKVKCKVDGVFVDAGPSIDGAPSLVREIATYKSTVYAIPVICFLEVNGRVTCDKGHTPSSTTTEILNADSNDPAVSISGGYSHACAVLRSGSAKCWGNNADGALGTGFKSITELPVKVDK